MEIRTLKSFLVVAREENITKAATLLHITQPSLSRQMMQLEQEFGVQLFHRSNHHITLTDEGLLLKRRAEEILSLTNKTEKEMKQSNEVISGEISIGCPETKSIQLLTEIVVEFIQAYPDVYFDIYTAIADDVKERIEEGLLDIGLLVEPFNIENYHYIRNKEKEEWCILMRKDSPLASKEYITPKDLEHQNVILTKRESVKNELENWLSDSYKKIHVVATSNLSHHNRSIMVSKGLGIATCHAFDVVDSQLCLRPLYPKLEDGTVWVWKKGKVFSPAVNAFISFLKKYLQEDR